MKAEYERYRRDIEAYLVSTANLAQPRLVEYTATSIDNLGRLYGRGHVHSDFRAQSVFFYLARLIKRST